MIKFGVDLKDEMFIIEADTKYVQGCGLTHKEIVDEVLEDFGDTTEGFWRFSSLNLKAGLFTADIELAGEHDDGDFDLILKNIKEL